MSQEDNKSVQTDSADQTAKGKATVNSAGYVNLEKWCSDKGIPFNPALKMARRNLCKICRFGTTYFVEEKGITEAFAAEFTRQQINAETARKTARIEAAKRAAYKAKYKELLVKGEVKEL